MQPCPRIAESGRSVESLISTPRWREDGTCSYCGSLSPDRLFRAIAEKQKITPTDKNYKIYVTTKNLRAGQISIMGSSSSQEQPSDRWVLVTTKNLSTLPTWRMRGRVGDWVLLEPEPETIEVKFYFQHLSDEERKHFVELINDKKLNIDYPGYFYRLPFFCRPLPPSSDKVQ